MRHTSFAVLLTLGCMLAPPAGAQEQPLTLTRQQYQLYKDYQDALKDPRVIKMKPAQRLPAIARNFGVKEKVLAAAIQVGEQEGERVGPVETRALREAFKGTPLEGRVGEVRVDASQGHIVAYVEWLNSDPSKLDQEACWAAARGVKVAPLVGTFDLYAQDASAKDKRVYSALIGADRAVHIQEDHIVDYAQTLYLHFFEKRQSVATQP